MRIDPFNPGEGGKLSPDTNPRREAGTIPNLTYTLGSDMGTGKVAYLGQSGMWYERWRRWRDAFNQRILPNVRRYWALYRNFEDQSAFPAGQEWRDRTVIPESYKIIETIVPRKVLSVWGMPNSWGVKGRGYKDESYESMVQTLMEESLDEIGTGDPRNELFIKKLIDGERYRQIMGHVFWKCWWRTHKDWLRTKRKLETGKWEDVEVLETLYDNVDIQWLGLDSVALDITGARRWLIEKVMTSLETLREENDAYKSENGVDLYKNLDLLELNQSQAHAPQKDSFQEPRDTERWPLSTEYVLGNPGEHQVELWLCWDNVNRTLTKIANRSVELDHGLAPTPYGFDPFISLPAVPIPGRVYGDSKLNWTGPLSRYQTRIARARADEVLLNIFQQYIYREGSLRGAQHFWRPGGFIAIDSAAQDSPLTDHFAILPRRPVFQEAWQEEAYRQQQQEAAAGTDQMGAQGMEATNKSRDVSATEVQQRVLQGSTRSELERVYDEVAFKKVLLGMVFDLLRQNLTEPKRLHILEDQEGADDGTYQDITLEDIQRPVDIVITGGTMDISTAEKLQEIDRLVNLAQTPAFAPYLQARQILIEMLKNTRTLARNTKKFVKTDQMLQQEQQDAAAQQMAAQGGGPSTPNGGPAGPSSGLPPFTVAPGGRALPTPINSSTGRSPGNAQSRSPNQEGVETI